MNEEQHEPLTVEEIKQRLRNGYTFHPTQPGLKEAARELIRPLVEKIEGREIIYECRIAWLMRVDYLETDDEGFRAVGSWIQEIESPLEAARRAARRGYHLPPEQDCSIGGGPWPSQQLDFGARWDFLHLCGSAVKMYMVTDCFYPDPKVVAEVKAAMVRGDQSREIFAILERAKGQR